MENIISESQMPDILRKIRSIKRVPIDISVIGESVELLREQFEVPKMNKKCKKMMAAKRSRSVEVKPISEAEKAQ